MLHPPCVHRAASRCVGRQEAVARQGKFFLAVPGGSVLKMCGGLAGRKIDWANTFLFYANHKVRAARHSACRPLRSTRESVSALCCLCVDSPAAQASWWLKMPLSLRTLQCVPNDDKSSTHKKALDIFINKVRGPLACVQA